MPFFLTNQHGFMVRRAALADITLTSLGTTQKSGALSGSWSSDAYTVGINLPVVTAIHTYRTLGNVRATDVTIGGFTATLLAESPANNAHCSLWGAAVTGLTSVSVDATFSASTSGPYFRAWSLANLSTLSARDTISDSGDPATGTIDCPAGGVIIGGATNHTDVAHSWVGITELTDVGNGTGVYRILQAKDVFSTAQTGLTVSCDPGSASTAYMAVVSLR